MQIKFDPSIGSEDQSHTLELPAMTIEGREHAEKICQQIRRHAVSLWPASRTPRAKTEKKPENVTAMKTKAK